MSFDGVSAEHKQSHIERRSMLSVADLDEEEQRHDYVAEECEKIEENSKIHN